MTDNTRHITKVRNHDLQHLHDQILSIRGINQHYLTRRFVIDRIMASPAPRFYIDSKRAEIYVTAWYRGEVVHKSIYKNHMVQDLVSVFEEIRDRYPDEQMSDIWEMVVQHPAKSFYMSRKRVEEVIYNWRKNGEKKHND